MTVQKHGTNLLVPHPKKNKTKRNGIVTSSKCRPKTFELKRENEKEGSQFFATLRKMVIKFTNIL